ncbi:MAG: urea carboxylase [Succinivibrio sp.]
MFSKVLIANRGAIACRIILTLREMGIKSVAVYNEADRDSLHVQMADESYSLGEGAVCYTYLDQQKIIDIVKKSGAQAIHPGYGFLSENPDFVRFCEKEGVVFLGPTSEQMISFGLKHEARAIAQKAGVPLPPGTSLLETADEALENADKIGYPVMLKSTAGGGGIGMQRCYSAEELSEAFEKVKHLAQSNFSTGGVFLEKFIEHARHIEVQIFGDGKGNILTIGERDCSTQRRNQKVIEECPAPGLTQEVRQELQKTAVALGSIVKYRGAGTVEYVYDADAEKFYFLEVNTRLQVEHGVTEMVYGVDIVKMMLQLGCDELPDLNEISKSLKPRGHAIEARLYAEDPAKNFRPSAGTVSSVSFPKQDRKNIRIDTWIESGSIVSPLFDPMLAKVIAFDEDRLNAISKLKDTLSDSLVYGIETNQRYLINLLASDLLLQGRMLTRSLNDYKYSDTTIDILTSGTQTTIQDYPGRVGMWDVGVPPSGPFDNLSFRLANRLLNNPEDAAGLEITVSGPTLSFNCDSEIALTGAEIKATLDGCDVKMYQPLKVKAGQVLKLGKVKEGGVRAYLAVQGGFNCPLYLGSRSTFTLGMFGGHAGRALKAGDVLHISAYDSSIKSLSIDESLIPEITHEWNIRVIYGPHGAPDFFTKNDIDTLFSKEYEVHYNSSRTGIRLIGPKPEWARENGGEAGLHPSNIHDNAYAIGTIDFTGDMPILLGPDGPSLGGFVCPATIIRADLWKMGQLKAGDKVKFIPVSLDDAKALETAQLASIKDLKSVTASWSRSTYETAVIKTLSSDVTHGTDIVYRMSGEDNILVEYGPQVIDLELRFRAHVLMMELKKMNLEGIIDLTPGIRSLQVHFDSLKLDRNDLLDIMEKIEKNMPDLESITVPSRVVYLPVSWDDEQTRLAIKKYDELVRKNAPWFPSNIEFIRRINGLDSVEDVKNIIFNATYLVYGLGDVYLGAPVATPIDPRHRLVTTKYNPARTWTPENAVGIGGAYMCVYGMEGPGGYQFFGRTLQMWNRNHKTEEFQKPWLLRFFDQIRFFEVTHDELMDIRHKFLLGQYHIKIEDTQYSFAEYKKLLTDNHDEIVKAKKRQQDAFDAEYQRWVESGQVNFSAQMETVETSSEELVLEDNETAIESEISCSVWKTLVKEGDSVKEGDVVMIVESMKMEIQIAASCSGTVSRIIKGEGSAVTSGQPLMIIRED